MWIKNKLNFLLLLAFTSIMTLQTHFAYADNTVGTTASPSNTALPLSATQIAKLQHLFKSSGDTTQFQATAPLHEHVIWDQTPIDIVLPVGIERMVSFPTPVQFGYDKTVLNDEILQVQNNNGVLYLKVKQGFTSQRVQVKCIDSGKIILLNLSARKGASATPLDVAVNQSGIKPSLANNAIVAQQNNTDEEPLSSQNHSSMTAVSLTRFAAQQLYAPKRLLTQPPNIYRVPMRTHKTIPLLLDNSFMAMPLASWRSGDLFVTVVLLRNSLTQPLTLDSRNLCGTWQTATFFPLTQLSSRGSQQDSTTVFLVSKRPFAESLKACGI